MSAFSIRDIQDRLYGDNVGPPILPHGEDLEVIIQRRRAKKRRKLSKRSSHTTKTSSTPTAVLSRAISSSAVLAESSIVPDTTSTNPSPTGQLLEERFPASDLPAGFPPELAFRALAAYSTIRTLSLKLRLSPFTPVVFLRALNLPVPTRLLGHVHVALLRLLLPHLGQHYHWGAAMPHSNQLKRFPWLPNTKKRKLDGLRWPLRAGDNMEFLDPFTWPVFLDDYAHLTADQLWWSSRGPPYDELNRNVDDPKDNPNVWKNLDVSTVPADWVDPAEDWRERRNPRVPSISVLYLNRGQGDGYDDSDVDDDILESREEDEDFDLATAAAEDELYEETASQKKRKRGRPRKSESSTSKPAHAPSHRPITQVAGMTAPTQQPQPTANTFRSAMKKDLEAPPSGIPSEATLATNGFTSVASPSSRVLEVSFPAPRSLMKQTSSSSIPTHSIPMTTTAVPSMNMRLPAVKQQRSLMASICQLPVVGGTTSPHQHQNGNMVPPNSSETFQMQQQLQAQQNSALVASLTPKPKVQNHMAQRFLPTTKVPSAWRTGNSYIKTKKPVDPKMEAAADLIDNYAFGVKPASEMTKSDPSVEKSSREARMEKPDPDKIQNEGDLESKETKTVAKIEECDNKVETVDVTEAEEEMVSEEPCVLAHFEALKELRRGTAYHLLSVERKLDILEFLIDEVLTLDVVADEMAFRYNSKEQYDHPYGDLPKKEEYDDLENDDQCAVCLGDGDLLCCDGCPSSYHQQCIDLPLHETLPEGKWYCPECVLVDPAKFGPLREGPKSCVDWFHLRDVCRSQEHLLSLTNNAEIQGPTLAMGEDAEYIVIHGYVFQRRSSAILPTMPLESPNAPKCLSKANLASFLAKVGAEDRKRWPVAQIPSNYTSYATSPTYLASAATYDPNIISNKYRKVPPLHVPKRLNFSCLKTVEEECCRMPTSYISDCLSRSMKSDYRIIQRQALTNPPFSDIEIAKSYAKELQNKLLKSLLIRTSCHSWATDIFPRDIAKVKSIKAVCRIFVSLIDAAHPRVFTEEWYESPSQKAGAATDTKKKTSTVMLCEDSTPELEVTRRTWQCMQPGNVPCALSKKLVKPREWIAEVRPDLAHPSSQKTKRKRDNQEVRQPVNFRQMVDYDLQKVESPQSNTAESALEKVDEEEEEEAHHLRRTRHEKTTESTETRSESLAHVQNHIDKEQEKLVSFVLGLPHELWIREPNWPVAGRQLFEPVGELSKAQVRRLARRAGSVRAPFIMYSEAFEVGQASCYHIWRKQMLVCTNFEDMLIGMRTISTFLDAEAIKHGISAARKSAKNAATKLDIYCSFTDISCGEESYLVLGKNGSSGTWVSSRKIDIKPLVLYQSKMYAGLEAKRRAQLLKNSAPKVRQLVPPLPPSENPPSTKSISGLPDKVNYIIHNHNQKVLRLFWIHPDILGQAFIQSRNNLRIETTVTLSQSLRTLGVNFDTSRAKSFLVHSERKYLESMREQYPAILKQLRALYPANELSTPNPVTAPPKPSDHHKTIPESDQKTPGPASGPVKRRDYRCGKCGQTGHNAKKCPSVSASPSPLDSAPPVPTNPSLDGVVTESNHLNFPSRQQVGFGPNDPNGKSQKRPRIDPTALSSSYGPPDNVDPEVWRRYLASQGHVGTHAKPSQASNFGLTGGKSPPLQVTATSSSMNGMASTTTGRQHVNHGRSTQIMHKSTYSQNRPFKMGVVPPSASGMSSATATRYPFKQESASQMMQQPTYPHQQLNGRAGFTQQFNQQGDFPSDQYGYPNKVHTARQQLPGNQSQNVHHLNPSVGGPMRIQGVQPTTQNSHSVSTKIPAPTKFNTSSLESGNQSSPASRQGGLTAQISQLLSNQGGNMSSAQVHQLMNEITRGSTNTPNVQKFTFQPGIPSRQGSLNHPMQHNYSSASYNTAAIKHHQQQMRGGSSTSGSNSMNNIPHQFLDVLEPTPLPGLSQQSSRRGANIPSQLANYGEHNIFPTPTGHQTQMFDQDFFSPTPINPNHQLNRRASHQEQLPSVSTNYPYHEQFSQQGNNQSFPGHNMHPSGQHGPQNR